MATRIKQLGSWLRLYDRALLCLVVGLLVLSGIDASLASAKSEAEPAHDQKPVMLDSPRPAVRHHIKPDYALPAAEAGSVPVIDHIATTEKVVFLTLDDGLVRQPETTRLLKAYNVKAPMFLNDEYVTEDPDYFEDLLGNGLSIGSHTVDHADLTTLGYDQQVSEICTNADTLERELGRRPTLFRPPYGSFDDNTIRAAEACGMSALVMWSAKANGGSMQYQYGHTGLEPGDIVLMHFREEFKDDFTAFVEAARDAGLQPADLNEWLK